MKKDRKEGRNVESLTVAQVDKAAKTLDYPD